MNNESNINSHSATHLSENKIQVEYFTKRFDFRVGKQNQFKLFLLICAGILIVLLSAFLNRSDISTLLVGSGIVFISVFFVIAWIIWPPKRSQLIITEKGIHFAEVSYTFAELDSWTLVEFDQSKNESQGNMNLVELAINRRGNSQNYFYLEGQKLQQSGIVDALSGRLPYNEDLLRLDRFNHLLRQLGLR